MRLDGNQRRGLFDDGYLLVPGLVPRARVEAALKAINHSLGEEGIAKDQIWTLRSQTFCPELAAAPEILDLYRATPLAALAEAAIGAAEVPAPATGQIALRFPQKLAEPKLPFPHIDGMPGPLNGVAPGTLYHFTALGAVFLSDVRGPFQGNFTVWPGSHRALEAHFRAHGTDELLRGFPPVSMAPARQLEVEAGDVLLAHHQLAHNAAPNVGPHVRYAVFFRLARRGHDPTSTATLVDLWREWDGVRGAPGS
ncbi:MAG TPA: phytanoyl-CoA dioxygenase family protein [Polyangia bacterium]|nr:phytanoyl-CoA dioxygenase family protein [Polyangia bacterium]